MFAFPVTAPGVASRVWSLSGAVPDRRSEAATVRTARTVLFIATLGAPLMTSPAAAADRPARSVPRKATRVEPGRADSCVSVDARFNDGALPAALARSMEDEAVSIWRRYGVRVRWRRSAASIACETGGSFDVLVERRQAAATAGSDAPVLGRTYLQLAAIDHAPIHIDYDATERIVRSLNASSLTRLTGHSWLGDRDIGRALGRVLAHEIGHVLLALPSHQAQGLMRRTFKADDLVTFQRSSFTLSTGEVSRLRQRGRMWTDRALLLVDPDLKPREGEGTR